MDVIEVHGTAAVEALERELGAGVRRARKAQSLTQQELADRANVSIGTVKNLESGKGSTVATLIRVLRVLGRENWIEELYVDKPTFNPFDLLPKSKGR